MSRSLSRASSKSKEFHILYERRDGGRSTVVNYIMRTIGIPNYKTANIISQGVSRLLHVRVRWLVFLRLVATRQVSHHLQGAEFIF